MIWISFKLAEPKEQKTLVLPLFGPHNVEDPGVFLDFKIGSHS